MKSLLGSEVAYNFVGVMASDIAEVKVESSR